MTMRSMTLLVSFLVATMAISIAEAQLGGLGGLIGGLLGSTNVQGIVFCSLDGNIGVNGTATPVFPNALVQLQCGGNVVSSTTTNQQGAFSMLLDPLQNILSSLLTNCGVVVKTPLSTCNINLPAAGILQAPLKYAGDTVNGLLRILNVVPGLFNFLPIRN